MSVFNRRYYYKFTNEKLKNLDQKTMEAVFVAYVDSNTNL